MTPSAADSVGVGSYAIDLHPSTAGDNYIDFAALPFQVPLGALLALATTAGVLLSSSAALAHDETALGWLTALVAGMLMHVVTHDWAARIPKERGARALDALHERLESMLDAIG